MPNMIRTSIDFITDLKVCVEVNVCSAPRNGVYGCCALRGITDGVATAEASSA